MSALQTTLAVSVLATLLADGAVNWDITLPAIKEQVNAKVAETNEIREDIFSILNDVNEVYVDEGTLVGKVMSRRERARRTALKTMGDALADEEDVYTMEETQALRGKIQSFIDENRTKTDEKTGKLVQGLFQSRRGRNGGIQTAENAEHIEYLAEDKKKKTSKL